ncbi:hypothetical protein MSG28_014189 [Choristoneura fumiferana]|uniref:Uncharacterized protein n=1 Tax=Choristoneura fumiferana TaxID=7141 RepID=A0ACC0JGF2_CHOFU|nr:hypothetical protein MSG28_014189 [Choristoneura fumiferana]
MDTDSDIDSDQESQLNDLAQLQAAIDDDEPSSMWLEPYMSPSGTNSLQSQSIPSTSSAESAQEHARIDAALGLNKLLDEKLKRLEKVLVGRLHECRQKLRDLHELAVPTDKQDRQETFRYVNCGKPYFKDKANFPAPDNEDTILMAKSNMYDFSEITAVPGWTVKDKSNFTNLLLKMSIDIKKKELTSKIAQLKRDGKDIKPKKLEKEIDAINKEITALNNKSLKDIALPIDQEYDWEIVANKLNRRHSATEYRSLWKVFLHPSINKSVWDKVEHSRLHDIANEHNLQDWDSIAKALNTARTGYQCFVYFRTNMSNTFTGKKWTKEEEEYLRRLIEYYKEDEYIPWGKVASSMENRTKIQIYNKYFRLVEKRKGRFLPEEDAVILTCLDKFGLNFKKMSEYLPGRSATQIRVRYGVLAKKRISTIWTVQEDKKLLQIMANEDSLTNYSYVTDQFPGKTRVHIRGRYITLLKWMKRHPNSSLENAPRRGARRLGHGLASDNLNKATEKLKNRIESEIEKRKIKRITRDSPLEVIEDAIVANLLTEKVKEEESRKAEVCDDDLVVLNNDFVISAQSLNVTNLQKLIIFLRGKLNKDRFKHSSFADQYPGLLDTQQVVNLFQVKSYSKKGKITTPVVVNPPDIWGENTLDSLTYVLPPHYATITGCRKLMAYINLKTRKGISMSSINIGSMMKRNPILKQQMFLLMERFNALFLFPMVLSNEGPERLGRHVLKDPNSKKDNDSLEKIEIGPPCNIISLGIPNGAKNIKALSSESNSAIDLADPSPEQQALNCVQKVVFDNNAFRFVTVKEKKIFNPKKKIMQLS